jgi:hypothetical protein
VLESGCPVARHHARPTVLHHQRAVDPWCSPETKFLRHVAFIREPVASSAGEQRARAMSKPDVPAAEAPKAAEPPPVTAVAPAPRVVLPGAPAERPESAGESRGVALPTARARCRAAGGTRLAAE